MKLTIPTSQREITLRQYIDAHDKPEREQVAIYLNITLEVLDQIPQDVYDEALQSISKAMQEEPELERFFMIGGTKYGFVPDLNDIEVGAFAVAEDAVSDPSKAHLLMNALYRPVKRQVNDFYSVKDYDPKAANRMLEAPLIAYSSCILFFYHLGNDLGIYTQNYTRPQADSKAAT